MQTSQYLSQYVIEEKISSEPWPEDATLYQPYEAEQILLPENASCLAVKTYLMMANLPYQVRPCANAEFMSPGGRMTKLPFLRAGNFIFAEFEPIVTFAEQKQVGLGQWLDIDEKADMRTYVSLIENIFTMAELYVSFIDKRNYNEITAKRNGCVFPWPLNILQNSNKRRQAQRLLKTYQWNRMSMDDVTEKVEKCCESLVLKLTETNSNYFYGNEPTELDAIAFGHLFCILTTELPNNALAETVQKFEPLVKYVFFIEKSYFH